MKQNKCFSAGQSGPGCGTGSPRRHARAASFAAGQVGDGPGDLEDPVVGPGREPEMGHRAAQQGLGRVQRAKIAQSARSSGRCSRSHLAGEPLQLPLPGGLDPVAHAPSLAGGRARSRTAPPGPRRGCRCGPAAARRCWPGSAGLAGRAAALVRRVVEVAAGAGIHGADQHEPGRDR